MTITEAQRSALYESMKAVHGADITEAIMSAYTTSEDDQVATKRDLDQLRAATRAEMADLRSDLHTEMANLRSDLHTEMANLRAEMAHLRSDLHTDVANLRADMGREFASATSDLTRTLGTWIFASQAGVVAAVALVVGLLG